MKPRCQPQGSASGFLLVRCHQPSKSPPLLYFYNVFNSSTNLLHKNGDGEGLNVSPLPWAQAEAFAPPLPSLCRGSGGAQLWGAQKPAGFVRAQDGSAAHRVT